MVERTSRNPWKRRDNSFGKHVRWSISTKRSTLSIADGWDRKERVVRIGVDCRYLKGPRVGVDNYRYFLTLGMLAEGRGHQIVLFTDKAGLPPELEKSGAEVVRINLPLIIWETIGLPVSAPPRRIDLFHFHRHHIPFIRPFRTVTTVHDIAYYRFPTMYRQRRRHMLKHCIAHAVKVADRIIVHSDAVRDDLVHFLKVPRERIVRIYCGFDPQFLWGDSNLEDSRQFLNRLGIHGSFILSVATLQPRKNLRRLLEAYAGMEETLRDRCRLLLIGGNEGELDALKEACRTLGIQRHVDMPGFLPSEELRGLYRQASCFVFPSLHEGFGFPLLEAMASGCPACASRISSLPEVGGDAVLYFNPYSVEDIRRSVQTLLTDEGQSKRLREKGLRRARLFSWKQATRTTLELFEEVCRNGRAL